MSSLNLAEQQCTKCKKIKPIPEFYMRKSGDRAGRTTCWCKECICEQAREYHQKHKNDSKKKVRKGEYDHVYWKQNKTKIRKRFAKWYEKNRERILEKQKKYREENAEAVAATKRKSVLAKPQKYRKLSKISRQRRIAHERLVKSTLTVEEWDTILEEWNYCCAYCGTHQAKLKCTLEQDHVMPVSRGGNYTAQNIVPACKKCNRKKSARTPEEANMPFYKNKDRSENG